LQLGWWNTVTGCSER